MMARPLGKFTPGTEPTPGSQRWLTLVGLRLLDGYGVEDIALGLNCAPDAVRKHVQFLRRNGVFKAWWGR